MMYNYRSIFLEPKFAWWPKKIDEQWVWLKRYWIKRCYSGNGFSHYINENYGSMTQEEYLLQTLKGNIDSDNMMISESWAIQVG